MHRLFMVLTVLFLGISLSMPATAAMNKFEKEVEKEKGAVKLSREVVKGGYGLITASELNDLITSGKAMVIVDTMPFEASYKKAHVPGAKQFLFPIPDMDEWNIKETAGQTQDDYKKLLGDDKDKLIVVYCGFVKCTRSHNGAVWAKKLGYTNVKRFSGGIYAWKGAGYKADSVK